MSKKEFIGGIHYYLENGKVVFTEKYHIDRGQYCGSKCRHCPYKPRHKKGEKELEARQ